MGIAAVGQTSFTKEERPITDLLLEAALAALEGVDRKQVDCVLVSTNDSARYLGAILSELLGVRSQISHTVESMCGSGGISIVSAYSYIKSGLAETALVVGAERPESPGAVLAWDVTRGQFQDPIYWGSILTRSYKRRYSVSPELLASVPAKNRRMALDNPYALCGREHTILDIVESREITADLRLLDCSRACSGSAAVVLASAERCRSITDRPVWVTGLSQDTSSASFGGYSEHHSIESSRRAAAGAYRMAGIDPSMIDVAEVHDAFSVCEPMALESLGIAGPGEGARLSHDLHETGSRRVNPRGGLLGAGHPLGATGMAQAAEIVLQLRGEAGRRQVEGANTGLTHGMSAAGTSSVVVVMQS